MNDTTTKKITTCTDIYLVTGEAGDSGPVVTEVDIQHIVSSWTGIPVEKVSTDESDSLLKMEETLHKPVIGHHDEALRRRITACTGTVTMCRRIMTLCCGRWQ